MKPEQFDEFFEAAYGFAPFPWQTRLAAQVTNADSSFWPECLALPTGAGKTTCLDVALFSLACQAGRPAGERTAPRRIIFVVDRRVIVDEAFDHAVELARKLALVSGGVLKDIADALRTIAGHDAFADVNPTLFTKGLPLTCHQLRGGMYRDDAWARTPSQPCVIASTVDQIGSRLLFRGYGQSSRSWSKSAGLAGNDSLIILDEAHCANPFLQTIRSMVRFRSDDWSERPLGTPFHFAIMSATPPAGIADGLVFRDDPADRDHEILGKRLMTSKPAKLVEARKASGKNWQTELAIELVSQALELINEQRMAVAVLVNRVATAKLVNQLLALLHDPDADVNDATFKPTDVRKLRKRGGEVFAPWQEAGLFDHELMTGRMRSFDKDAVTQKWLSRLKADPTRDVNAGPALGLPRPVFITATQCLEVGANLDFDGMVSECASLDALRQRFGRLNRIGRWDTADGVVVVRSDQTSPTNEDPIYGDKLARTWLWLNENAATDGDAERSPTIDFGISAMAAKLVGMTSGDLRHYVLQGGDAPVMLPAHVDLWSQTSPEPRPSPDVAQFLHGADTTPADVHVCWRADVEREFLPAQSDYETAFRETIALCPPTSAECLPVPIVIFKRWLTTPDKSRVDVELLADTDAVIDDHPDRILDKQNRALVWRGVGKSNKDSADEPRTRLIRHFNDVKSGDTIVIPASLGGWAEFGHLPNGQPVDVGDVCQFAARRRPILRLCPFKHQSTEGGQSLLSDYGINLENDEFESLRDALEEFDESDELGAIDKTSGWRSSRGCCRRFDLIATSVKSLHHWSTDRSRSPLSPIRSVE